MISSFLPSSFPPEADPPPADNGYITVNVRSPPVLISPRRSMDRTQACGACDRGSIPLEGVYTIISPVFWGYYCIDFCTERNRTVLRKVIHSFLVSG